MDDLVFYKKGKPIAIIAPSTLFSRGADEIVVNGPAGISSVRSRDEQSLENALNETGALILGSPDEIQKIKKLLQNPVTSRTASYFLSVAHLCSDVIADMEVLRNAKILVAGCGGIGSSVAMLLAGAGIQNLILTDNDFIEKSNLNRQLFWTLADLGHLKVDVLKNGLNARFENLSITTHAEPCTLDLLKSLIPEQVHGAVITADDPPTLARDGVLIAEEFNIPVVSGGYLHHFSTSFLFKPEDARNLVDSVRSDHSTSLTRLPSGIMPSYGPVNFNLASVLCSNLISALAKNIFKGFESRVERWDSSRIVI
ncbi:ThiF family adenylyltransferase [Pseudomonas sp. W22_MBD1_FP4]|uniref:ThiF family adenylyltransferase n=1 Tax=Pseudomonas sp. W22_MBD1_FP4 TaxID=3240272 RepID=UPI003F99698C